MRSSRCGNISGFKGKGCHVGASRLEGFNKIRGGDLGDGFVKNDTIRINGRKVHSIFEGFVSHLGKEGSFGVLDGLSFNQDLNILQNFDLTFVNFGGDLQSVEETNLRGVHSGGSSRDNNTTGGDDSDLGDGINSVGFNNGHEFENGTVRDNHGNFTNHEFFEFLKLRHTF